MQKKSIDVVISFYGKFSGQHLSELTHKERPWTDARAGLSPGERGNHEITLESTVRVLFQP